MEAIKTPETKRRLGGHRFDDEMVVNPHVYGKIASHAPAMHVRRLAAGDLFSTYADSFDAIWDEAAHPAW